MLRASVRHLWISGCQTPEHYSRYWDQASVLVQVITLSAAMIKISYLSQLGLLDPSNLPVTGVDAARKVLDPFGLPSNTLMTKWKESEGKSID